MPEEPNDDPMNSIRCNRMLRAMVIGDGRLHHSAAMADQHGSYCMSDVLKKDGRKYVITMTIKPLPSQGETLCEAH